MGRGCSSRRASWARPDRARASSGSSQGWALVGEAVRVSGWGAGPCAGCASPCASGRRLGGAEGSQGRQLGVESGPQVGGRVQAQPSCLSATGLSASLSSPCETH